MIQTCYSAIVPSYPIKYNKHFTIFATMPSYIQDGTVAQLQIFLQLQDQVMWVFGIVKFHLHMAYERPITKGIHIGNDIYHMLVQFSIKAQKSHCIWTCKCKLLQKNLQLCYSAILNVESHCSSIIKPKILFYSFSLSTLSP